MVSFRSNYLDILQRQTMMRSLMVNDTKSCFPDKWLAISQPGDHRLRNPFHCRHQFNIVSDVSRDTDKSLRKSGFLALKFKKELKSCVIHAIDASAKLFELIYYFSIYDDKSRVRSGHTYKGPH